MRRYPYIKYLYFYLELVRLLIKCIKLLARFALNYCKKICKKVQIKLDMLSNVVYYISRNKHKRVTKMENLKNKYSLADIHEYISEYARIESTDDAEMHNHFEHNPEIDSIIYDLIVAGEGKLVTSYLNAPVNKIEIIKSKKYYGDHYVMVLYKNDYFYKCRFRDYILYNHITRHKPKQVNFIGEFVPKKPDFENFAYAEISDCIKAGFDSDDIEKFEDPLRDYIDALEEYNIAKKDMADLVSEIHANIHHEDFVNDEDDPQYTPDRCGEFDVIENFGPDCYDDDERAEGHEVFKVEDLKK